MRLAIQRIGKNTKLIIDGDFRTQVDSSAYEGSRNGMRRASDVFRGMEYYGQVKLPIIYRSELAKRAELM
jgi:predicted ribonuclease YlaK